MKRWTFTLLAAVVGMASTAEAAVIAPVKQYAKPNEPVDIRFLNENEQGKKALEKLGLAAVEIDGLFTQAQMSEVLGDEGATKFSLYKFDGTKLEPQGKAGDKPMDTVNIAAIYPQIKEAGTYILTWKDATPLVIETLRNPIAWAPITDADARTKEAQLKRAAGDPPVVTHIALLEHAVITTDKGVIKAKFAYDVAPHNAANFIKLARQKLYDGSAFHRIMAGFMIQGGDSLALVKGREGSGGPGYSVPAELSSKKHERGTLSMARLSRNSDSAGSQFFIMHARSEHLDWGYTAFGDVIDGLKVVDEIAKTPVSDNNGTVSGEKPKIESVRILPATLEMYGIKK